MGLQQQQDLLARLYTDEDFRRAFSSAPEKIGAENELSDVEIREIAAIMPEELNFFADSLFWKRLREAEKFLPLTKSILANDFTKLFREFSQTFNPQSVKKHFEDALGFTVFLEKQTEISSVLRDVIKFERAGLLFNSGSKKIVFEKFAHDIREILSVSENEKSFEKLEFRPRKTFAIWLGIGKISKRYFL